MGLSGSGAPVLNQRVVADQVAQADGVYFNHPGIAVVTWDPASQAVCIQWQGWANPAEFSAALDAGLRALVARHSSRWLADCRDMKVIQRSDQQWLDSSWFPRALALGMRRMAIVRPTSGLTMTNIDEILGRIPGTELDVNYFDTVEEATRWLAMPHP